MKAKSLTLLFVSLIYNLSIFSQNKTPNTELVNIPNENITAKEDPGVGIGIVIPIADRVTFTYDESGNQIQRLLCINCVTNRISKTKIIEGSLVFYPNPVKEELHIDFDNSTNNKRIEIVTLYSITGQLIKSYTNSGNLNNLTIPFNSLSQGNYNVNVLYNTGEIIDLKIIKK